jgi:tetratricopeptide (TPR) repeat protein
MLASLRQLGVQTVRLRSSRSCTLLRLPTFLSMLNIISNLSYLAISPVLSSHVACSVPKTAQKLKQLHIARAGSVPRSRWFHSSPLVLCSHFARMEVEKLVKEAQRKLHEEEDAEGAIEIFDQALERGGGQFDPEIYIEKGIVLFENGKSDEAMDVLSQGIAAGARTVDAFAYRGLCFSYASRHEEALSDFDEALGMDPRSLPVLIDKGRCLTSLERFTEALVAFEWALMTNPDSYDALRDKARTLSLLNQFKDAVDAYDACLKEKPMDVDVILEKINAQAEMGDRDAALTTFDSSLDLLPGHSILLANKASLLVVMQRHPEALQVLDEILKVNPSDSKALMHKSNSLSKLGRFKEALKACEEAIKCGLDTQSSAADHFRQVLQQRILEPGSDLASSAP